MLSNKFKNRKKIYFSWNGKMPIDNTEVLSETNRVKRYGYTAKGYDEALKIDAILAKDGREYEVRA